MSDKKYEVKSITRDIHGVYVLMKFQSRQGLIEYTLDNSAQYFSDEELTEEFEDNPKKANQRYGGYVDLH